MGFSPARLRATKTVRTKERLLAAAQVGKRGALLTVDAAGAYVTCGANPALVAAVAASDYGPNVAGFNHLGVDGFPPGSIQGHSVSEGVPFLCGYIGALPAAPGLTYGVTLDADGEWKVDFTKNAANQRVTLIALPSAGPEVQPKVEVVFLAANVQVNQ